MTAADPELMAKLILTLFSKTVLDNVVREDMSIEGALTAASKEILELIKKTDE